MNLGTFWRASLNRRTPLDVVKHSDRIVGSTVRIQLGKFRPRDLTESMEAGSVGATLVSFGWVSIKPEDGMNLSQIPKSVARDTSDPANGEAQGGHSHISGPAK